MRECLYLGGFEDEELNVIPNSKHAWRTNFVKYKDELGMKVKKFDTAMNRTAWNEIEHFIHLLEGEDEDRFQPVFGECCQLLPQFLEAAEERASQGIFQKELRQSAKRTNEELGTTPDDEKQQPSKKQAHLEVSDDPLEYADLDSY